MGSNSEVVHSFLSNPSHKKENYSFIETKQAYNSTNQYACSFVFRSVPGPLRVIASECAGCSVLFSVLGFEQYIAACPLFRGLQRTATQVRRSDAPSF